jgi:hypothetical protein
MPENQFIDEFREPILKRTNWLHCQQTHR